MRQDNARECGGPHLRVGSTCAPRYGAVIFRWKSVKLCKVEIRMSSSVGGTEMHGAASISSHPSAWSAGVLDKSLAKHLY